MSMTGNDSSRKGNGGAERPPPDERGPAPFGPDHYTRDWDLLGGVAQEWAAIREKHKLGSKATAQQIEGCWPAIFRTKPPEWPHLRRLADEILRDQVLRGYLAHCYTYELPRTKRYGYRFAEILPDLLLRIICTIARNADKWLLARPGTQSQQHWARFWNLQNLVTEIGRAIQQVVRGEQSGTTQWGTSEDDSTPDGQRDCNYRGRSSSQLDETVGLLEEASVGLPEREARAFRDWLHNTVESTDAEEEQIARRHGMSREELNAVIQKALQRRR